jgi:predicted permease
MPIFSSTVRLARQLASPLVLILLVGAAVSAALREWVDAAIIVAIVLDRYFSIRLARSRVRRNP